MSDTVTEFDYSVDLTKAILWEYNDAEKLQSLINQKQSWYNENLTEFWENWYNDVFNVETANDFGLRVWSIILNVSFSIEQEERTDNHIWGFGSYHKNFRDKANFNVEMDNDLELTTEQKRLIIKLRFAQIVSRGTIPEINKALRAIFGYNVYAVDTYDMSTTYIVLTEQPDSSVQYILDKYDLIPRPAGVGIGTRVVTGREFGFGSFHNNFNNAFFGTNI